MKRGLQRARRALTRRGRGGAYAVTHGRRRLVAMIAAAQCALAKGERATGQESEALRSWMAGCLPPAHARSSVATHTRKWQTRRDGCPKLRKQVGVKRGTAGRESLKTVAPKPQQNNRSHGPTTSWQHCDPPTSLHGFRMTSRSPTRAKSGRGRACAWVL